MAIAKPKTSQLAQVINDELRKSRSDEFTLKRLEREAATLRSAPDAKVRVEALAILGMVHALNFDIEGTRRHFEDALRASGHATIMYENYASILGTLGMPGAALPLAEKAAQKSPDDPTVLRLVIKLSSDAFAVDKVREYARRLASLEKLEDDDEAQKALASISWQQPILELPGVTREALLQRYEAAWAVARAHKVRIQEERASVSSRGVLVEWPVDCNNEQIATMNLEVVDALSDFEPNPCEFHIAFGYCPLIARQGSAQG